MSVRQQSDAPPVGPNVAAKTHHVESLETLMAAVMFMTDPLIHSPLMTDPLDYVAEAYSLPASSIPINTKIPPTIHTAT